MAVKFVQPSQQLLPRPPRLSYVTPRKNPSVTIKNIFSYQYSCGMGLAQWHINAPCKPALSVLYSTGGYWGESFRCPRAL
jgi:hypothetical protein